VFGDGFHDAVAGVGELRPALVGGGAVLCLDVAGGDEKDEVFGFRSDVLFAVVGGEAGEVVVGCFELLELGAEVGFVGCDVDGGGVVDDGFGGHGESIADGAGCRRRSLGWEEQERQG
jgi:hypothetical protein